MTKILITGANGYLGSEVVSTALKYTTADIIALDLESKNESGERLSYLGLDLLAHAKDSDLYKKLNYPDIIIHLAWQDGFRHNADSHLFNLPAHYAFLKNMIDSGCHSISVMGTMHEIGYFEGAITEDTPCNPWSLYGIAKNALRQSVLVYSQDKDVSLKWLRAYYIMGNEEKSQTIFGKIYRMAHEGQKSFPFTTGVNKYDFISIKDLARQIIKASMQTEINGIINCCSGVPVALKDKVENFIKEKKLNIKPEYGAFPSRKYDSPAVWGDATLIKKIMERG